MGLLGSALGRALAGGGSSVADIANKYIDQDLALKRAQVLADIQRNSQVQTTKEIDQYQNDPTRRENLRGQTSLDAIAAARDAQAAKLSELTNDSLTAAGVARDNYITEATTPAKARAAGLVTRAQAENTAHDVAPGGKVIIGTGENTTPTAAEINDRLFREGLKDKKKGERVAAFDAQLKSVGDQMKEVNKSITEGVANGTLLTTKPEGDKGSPAYDAYQYLLKQKNLLGVQQSRLAAEYRAEVGRGEGGNAGGSSADPLGIRPTDSGKAPDGAAPPKGQLGDTWTRAADATRNIQALQEQLSKSKPGSDQYRILQGELKSEQARLAANPDPVPVQAGAPTAPAVAAPAPPAAPRVDVPAAPPPPVSAAQRRHDEAQSKAKEAVAARSAEKAAELQRTRQQFEADLVSMKPLDLVRKYDSFGARSSLSLPQLARLRELEKSL